MTDNNGTATALNREHRERHSDWNGRAAARRKGERREHGESGDIDAVVADSFVPTAARVRAKRRSFSMFSPYPYAASAARREPYVVVLHVLYVKAVAVGAVDTDGYAERKRTMAVIERTEHVNGPTQWSCRRRAI